jgi:membrane associated rhomboid family serine protease
MMDEGSKTSLRITANHRLAEEWELVLLAQGLSPSLRPGPDGIVLSVPQAEADRALASLSAYDGENAAKLAERVEPTQPGNWFASVAAALILLIFFFVTVHWLPAPNWFARGSADAGSILHGEIWRTVTSLTLHADVAHALSNAVAVALFLGVLSSMVGAGPAAALVLLAGAGGNLMDAFLHGSPHVAVGASTAVFGAVGVLGSLGMARRSQRALSRWRAWLPIAAALALLGMLGSGGERVDIWAHLCGLLAGIVLGVVIALAPPRAPGSRCQRACGAGAVAVLIYCWTLALR